MEDPTAKIASLEQELQQVTAQYDTLGSLLDKKNNEVYLFYHIAKVIASTHDFEDMVRQILGLFRKSRNIDRASLYLLDETGERLELRFWSGLQPGGSVSIAPGEGLPGRIVDSGEHSHIHDLALYYETLSDFIHIPGEEKRGGSYIGIALKSRNRTIGVIGMDSPVTYGLDVEDMDFLSLTAHQIAAGIEKARLFTKTEQLSQLDGLTGLYNRRIFGEKLEQEVARQSRGRKPLSLVMLDIDHFKRFNDAFGHQEGDTVLKELAAVIRSQCRHTTMDSCFRYGGEEFAVLLPELECAAALRVAERMRQVVEQHPFSVTQRHPGTPVTISLGVASLSGGESSTPEELLKKADDNLYRAKGAGRNRVIG